MDTALTVAATALLLLPGWALWMRLAGPQPSQEIAITGLAVALALAMVTLHACAYLGLSFFVAVWLCAIGAAAWSLFRHPPRVRIDRALALLALGAALIRFLPVLVQEFPPGWDPYFHLLVVRLIAQGGGHVATLAPFEDIPINYPTGTHLLLALIAKCTGASIYGVFQAVLAAFASLTCLQVYAWVHAASGNRRWALYAMAACAFLALQGSLDYYLWGGLPNLIGVYLLAGCLTIVAQREAGERRWWLLPPMYLGIALANHHVLMAAFAVLFALLVWLAFDAKRRDDARRLLLGGCAAALVAGPFLAYRFLSTGSGIDDTGLLTTREQVPAFFSIALSYGPVFFLALVAGAGLYARERRAWPLGAELLLPAAVLPALYVLFAYGGPQIMLALHQEPIAPFTPSRFLTDAALPLSAFAGLAFLRLEERLGRGVLPAVALLFFTNLAQYARQFEAPIDAGRLDAYRWVEANTRPDTLVIDNWVHAPVIANRAAINTALPSSELSGKASKRKLLLSILNREVDAEAAGVPVVMITHRQVPLAAPPGVILVHYALGDIVDLNPRIPAVPR